MAPEAYAEGILCRMLYLMVARVLYFCFLSSFFLLAGMIDFLANA